MRVVCRFLVAGLFAIAAARPGIAHAQSAADSAQDEKEKLAKLAQNPVGNLISIPFQDNASYGYGPYNRDQNTLNIQPVFPFSAGKDWNIVTRTIFPLVWLPVGPSGGVSGLSNVNFSAYLSPASPGKLDLGHRAHNQFRRDWSDVGVAAILSRTSHRAAHDAWFLGFRGGGQQYLGVRRTERGQNWNMFYPQVFVNYNFKGGLYLTSSPIITANWAANGGNVWTVPLGGGIGKIIKVGGKLPLNCNLSAYSYVARPAGAPDWTLRAQIAILLPKSILEGKK